MGFCGDVWGSEEVLWDSVGLLGILWGSEWLHGGSMGLHTITAALTVDAPTAVEFTAVFSYPW